MKFERHEVVGMAVAVVVAASLFAFVRFDVYSSLMTILEKREVTAQQPLEGAVVLKGDAPTALADAFSVAGKVDRLVIQDATVGEGTQVVVGSRVAVNYIGMLQNGKTFKSTYEDGEPYRFMVGMGDVIEGWDQGLLGMQAGGKRILVVPPALGYGARSLDGVPPNSTLLFSIELISIN